MPILTARAPVAAAVLRAGMNGTECAYADHLDVMIAAGMVVVWWFESIKLKLGDDWKTTYTPDFFVVLADGSLECHECKPPKGRKFWAREDAMVKIKVAARLFPFRFIIVWRQRGTDKWEQKPIGLGAALSEDAS